MELSINLKRMLDLVDEVFESKSDPNQLSFTEEDMEHLQALHPACLNEHANEDGPYAWISIFPTSSDLANKFVGGKSTERELFDKTLELNPTQLNTVYLCSALVLPEFRKNMIAFTTTIQAIEGMKNNLPIHQLLVWPFSHEGEQLAKKIAKASQLPLLIKKYS